ncbi:hypothetical protein [Roseiconus lacunae]|uniref:hypothetical protein n=1 Tax=Roseiconus lacunae TaxID=2605694 RepID=UPI0011F12598|nr:hypothetical protein [Roseiconus lacunae]
MQNPYQAPPEIKQTTNSVADALPLEEQALRTRRTCLVTWTVILPLNMIVPALMAVNLVSWSGTGGILAAVTILYGLGLWCCVALPGLAVRVLLGGSIVAFSQFFPIIQVFAGVIALELAGIPFDDDYSKPIGPLQSFLITTTVASILLGISLLIGSFLHYVKQQFK